MLQQVRTEGLSRAYEDEYALVGLNATFQAGTTTAILGPNGAGKSTLLNLLTLLMRPTEGAVFFDDVIADAGQPKQRALIGYVGHRTMLYRSLSGRENLAFFARLYGLEDRGDRIDDLLQRVGLSDDGHRPVSEYSRGMAQRLTLARALLPKPALLLLDEPFTGLDQNGLAIAEQLLQEERERGGITLLVSHDLATTSRVADRCLILKRGRLQYDGMPNDSIEQTYRDAVHVEPR
ncbi:MAG: heme ABC exporter ATP-binding protein CcmA [Bradymonadia bacterium]